MRKRLILGLVPLLTFALFTAWMVPVALASGPGPDPATWNESEAIGGSFSDLTFEATIAGSSVTVDCSGSLTGTVTGGTSSDSITGIGLGPCTAGGAAAGCTVSITAEDLPWSTNATKDGLGDFWDTIDNLDITIEFSGAGCPLGNPLALSATGSPTCQFVNGSPSTCTFDSDQSSSVSLSVDGTEVGTMVLDGTLVTGGTLS